MEERKRKIIKFSMIVAIALLVIIAIVESFVLISLNQKLDKLQEDYNQLQEQIKDIEESK